MWTGWTGTDRGRGEKSMCTLSLRLWRLRGILCYLFEDSTPSGLEQCCGAVYPGFRSLCSLRPGLLLLNPFGILKTLNGLRLPVTGGGRWAVGGR